MAIYTYQATTPEGIKVKGVLRAPDRSIAQTELRKRNLNVLVIKEQKVKKDIFGRPIKPSAKTKDVTVLTRQLATMIGAGLTLVESLETLYEQAKDPGLRMALDGIIEKVRGGSDLSSAMANYPKVFSRIYINMIKAAEASGQLDVVLLRLAEYMESVEELKREVRGAVVYPIFSLGLILAITGFLIVFIIPKFNDIFVQLQIPQLPLVTRIVVGVGMFSKSYVHIIILGAIVAFVIFRWYTSKTKLGLYQWHWAVLNIPIFGELMRKVVISRFSRTLATLLESGVNMLSALEIVSGVAGNKLVEDDVLKARDSVSKGKNLSDQLASSKIFPPIVVRMVAVGEKTGQLETLLKKISDFYEHEVRATVKALTSILEPMLIGIMGFVVGTIVLSIFLPIIEIQQRVMK